MDLEKLCSEVVRVVQNTGIFVQNEQKNIVLDNVKNKGIHDYVTYVDKASEERLVEGLSPLLPEAGFITEEGTSKKKGESYHWVIDPIDGTTNFIHGLSPYSISVGLMKDEEVILGVVYEVTLQECFYAWKEGGAYLNGKKITVSKVTKMKDSFFATGFPYDAYDRLEPFMKSLAYFFVETPGVRRLGSAAADLAYVACGRFDVFYEYSLKPYDVAGGVIIITEAGGKITDFKGGRDYIFGKEIVASNGLVHEEVVDKIQEFFL